MGLEQKKAEERNRTDFIHLTANYTLAVNQRTVRVDTTATVGFTVKLPPVAEAVFKIYTFRHLGGPNAVAVAPNGLENEVLGPFPTLVASTSAAVYSDGRGWIQLAFY